ncbi:DUF1493 family protein [Chitinophaga filiformis]|uniref:DUF1493 family protein n=1 Tax=Chitinophaga filiformis TaxID=104663 RepID=A0ABY4I1H3_CHIFI|nr:DUF1493 family protein [Chitinophaga filiformis]UPK69463.1 DUF1493 family protein [Chitinophaga filiformis]
MRYFGIEVFDGKVYKDFPLEENVPLSSQRGILVGDIWLLMYKDRAFNFYISIDWIGNAWEQIRHPDNFFKVAVTGGRETQYRVYHIAFVRPDLKKLKVAMQKAVDLVQHMRSLSEEEIDALPPMEALIEFIQEKFPQYDITENTMLFDDLNISGEEAYEFLFDVSRRFKFSFAGIDLRIFSLSKEALREHFELSEDELFRNDNEPVTRFTVKHLYAVMQNGDWFDPADV